MSLFRKKEEPNTGGTVAVSIDVDHSIAAGKTAADSEAAARQDTRSKSPDHKASREGSKTKKPAQKGRWSRRILLFLAIFIESIAIAAIVLVFIQTNYMVRHALNTNGVKQYFEQVNQNFQSDLDAILRQYETKTSYLAFLFRYDKDYPRTKENLKKLCVENEASNIVLLDCDGNVLESARAVSVDYTDSKYDFLRSVFNSKGNSIVSQTVTDNGVLYQCGAYVDPDCEVVFEITPSRIARRTQRSVNLDELVNYYEQDCELMITEPDLTVIQSTIPELNGENLVDNGIGTGLYELFDETEGNEGEVKPFRITLNTKSDSLEQQYIFQPFSYHGIKYAISMVWVNDSQILLVLVPYNQIYGRTITLIVSCILFFAVMIIVVYIITGKNGGVYIGFLKNRKKNLKSGKANAAGGGSVSAKVQSGGTAVAIWDKIGVLLASFFICLFFAGIFMLNAYSQTKDKLESQSYLVKSVLKDNDEISNSVRKAYRENLLERTLNVSNILYNNPDMLTEEKLSLISETLDLAFIIVFDENGKEVMTDGTYRNLEVNDKEENPFSVFYPLVKGAPYVIVDDLKDGLSSETLQYAGVLLEGENRGFILAADDPEILQGELKRINVADVLKTVSSDASVLNTMDTSLVSVEEETGKITYYSEPEYVGYQASILGISEEQMYPGWEGALKINDEKCYGTCIAYGNELIFLFYKDVITYASAYLTVTILIIFTLILILVYRLLTALSYTMTERKFGSVPHPPVPKDEYGRMTHVVINTGALLTTGLSLVIILIQRYVTGERIFVPDILHTEMNKINLLSVSGCVLIICITISVSFILERILKRLDIVGDSRIRTISHLLNSVLGFAKWLLILYYILSLFGVDTRTILASLGLVTLGISMGAKDLIADMLAGLWIIVAGIPRVGQLVDIGGFTGRVKDIGIRTISVESDDLHDIKVFNNADIKNVINLRGSAGCCDIDIPVSKDLHMDERIILRVIPKLRGEVPQLTRDPELMGLVPGKGWHLRCFCHRSDDKKQLEFVLQRVISLKMAEEYVLETEEAARVEAAKSEEAKAQEAAKAETAQPEASKAEAKKPEAKKPEAAKAEAEAD